MRQLLLLLLLSASGTQGGVPPGQSLPVASVLRARSWNGVMLQSAR